MFNVPMSSRLYSDACNLRHRKADRILTNAIKQSERAHEHAMAAIAANAKAERDALTDRCALSADERRALVEFDSNPTY